jgi:hypothetical protein
MCIVLAITPLQMGFGTGQKGKDKKGPDNGFAFGIKIKIFRYKCPDF